jgi:hypothetical protein
MFQIILFFNEISNELSLLILLRAKMLKIQQSLPNQREAYFTRKYIPSTSQASSLEVVST